MKIINIFVSGDEPRKVIFKDDLGCDEACKEQNSSKEDCDQQRVDSEPVTNNQGKGMVFCYQNCSDLLWEKIVLAIEKNVWNSRLRAENLQNFLDH